MKITVDIYPLNKEVYNLVNLRFPLLRAKIKDAFARLWQTQLKDVGVNLHYPTTSNADPEYPYLIIKVEAIPEKTYQHFARLLRDDLVIQIKRMEELEQLSIKISINFLSGPSILIGDGETTHKVDHQTSY